MPRHEYISSGSNTLVKSGEGTLYGILAGGLGVTGGSVFAVDTLGIGATPNYVTQLANSSNIAVIGPLNTTANPTYDLKGVRFQDGLVVAATSNAVLTVFYD
jgi:hypothetical protein